MLDWKQAKNTKFLQCVVRLILFLHTTLTTGKNCQIIHMYRDQKSVVLQHIAILTTTAVFTRPNRSSR